MPTNPPCPRTPLPPSLSYTKLTKAHARTATQTHKRVRKRIRTHRHTQVCGCAQAGNYAGTQTHEVRTTPLLNPSLAHNPPSKPLPSLTPPSFPSPPLLNPPCPRTPLASSLSYTKLTKAHAHTATQTHGVRTTPLLSNPPPLGGYAKRRGAGVQLSGGAATISGGAGAQLYAGVRVCKRMRGAATKQADMRGVCKTGGYAVRVGAQLYAGVQVRGGVRGGYAVRAGVQLSGCAGVQLSGCAGVQLYAGVRVCGCAGGVRVCVGGGAGVRICGGGAQLYAGVRGCRRVQQLYAGVRGCN